MPISRSTRTGTGRSSPWTAADNALRRVGIVDGCTEGRAAVPAHQMRESLHVRPDERVGQKDVGSPSRRDHLGFGDRRAFVLADAERLGQPDDLGHLVGLDVRPQPGRPSRQRDHVQQVLPDELGVDQERRTEEFRRVVELDSADPSWRDSASIKRDAQSRQPD